jgi:hypothetical protein
LHDKIVVFIAIVKMYNNMRERFYIFLNFWVLGCVRLGYSELIATHHIMYKNSDHLQKTIIISVT